MGEVEGEGMRWELFRPAERGVGGSGELAEPEEEEETEAERLRVLVEVGLIVIGSECLTALFLSDWSALLTLEKDILLETSE